MKIGIAGAGAIGGFLGAKLALSGHHQVSVLARGATLSAIQTAGITLQQQGNTYQVPVTASADPAALGPQELLIIAVKGQSLAALAPQLKPLIGSHTIIVPAMNGVPWWFLQSLTGLSNTSLHSIDPQGVIANNLPLEQVLGCVIHGSMSTPSPGVVLHKMGQGVMLGEPFAPISTLVQLVTDVLKQAGLDATAHDNIRKEIWYKLWGNLSTNPVTAITGATVDKVLADDLLRGFCSAMMAEARQIGALIDCAIEQTPEDRHQITRKLGAFKPSMLQDVEAGRSIELDGIVTSVVELGHRVGVETPFVNAMLGLMRVFARQHGLYE